MDRSITHNRFLPRSKSFDPSTMNSTTARFGHVETVHTPQQAASGLDGALFGFSSLGLQETPNRASRDHDPVEPVADVSMMSPLSDRSVEPMVVSDVSMADLDETDFPKPFGGSQPRGGVEDNDFDMESKQGDGTAWLWSIDTKKWHRDDDAQSVMTDVGSCVSRSSAASFVTTRSDDSGQTVTQRKPQSFVHSSSLPQTMFEKEYHPNNNNTLVKPAVLSSKTRCRKCLPLINCVLLVTMVTAFVIMGSTSMQESRCSRRLQFNVSRLESDLQKNVYGQHLAVQAVLEHISQLLSSVHKNVTVLSFHGWTGIGKNFVSTFIAKQLVDEAVHKIIIPLDFAHANDREDYELMMVKRITNNIPSCGFMLFVIDEVDKASPQVIQGLHHAIEHLKGTQLSDTKILVLLLSNSGGSAINRYLLDQLTGGKTRDAIQSTEVVNFMLRIDNALISHEWYVPLLEGDLIDAVVPFLPLEKSHTALCTKRYISETRPMLGRPDVEQIVDQVLQQMTFFPQSQELFSATGCRGVALKVDLTID